MKEPKKKQENKIETHTGGMGNQRISDIPASEFSLYTDKKSKSNFLMYNGRKKLTAYKHLNKRMLDFVKETFTVVVSGEYFNFDPADQEDLLFDNPAAVNRMNLEEAMILIDDAVRLHLSKVIRKIQKIEISLKHNDFKYNEISNRYEFDYSLRDHFNSFNHHIEITFDDICRTCFENGEFECEDILNLAKPFYKTIVKDLKLEDVFPGEYHIYKIKISPIVYSLLGEHAMYSAEITYDWMAKKLKNVLEDKMIDRYELANAIQLGKHLCSYGIFSNSKENIQKIIKKVSDVQVRQNLTYAYILVFAPQELQDSISYLGGDDIPVLPFPNPLSIRYDLTKPDINCMGANHYEIFGKLVYSFHPVFNGCFVPAENHKINESNPDEISNEIDSDKGIYIIPLKSTDSNEIKLIFKSSESTDSNTEFCMMTVPEEKVETAIFFLWSYFASQQPMLMYHSDFIQELFRDENIGELRWPKYVPV